MKDKGISVEKEEKFDAEAILEKVLESMGMSTLGSNENKFQVNPEFLEIVQSIGDKYKKAFKELAWKWDI